ncbi:MAG: lysoplasmalogenase [Bacteroidia bacterium]|nr:lysoplasmalogenase [Bacteroidia bacterium]
MNSTITKASIKTNRLFLVLFFIDFIIQLITRLVPNLPESVAMLSKSLLMPLLMFYYINNKGGASKRLQNWVLLALIFSFSGDVWLMFEGLLFFLLGLGSFLIAHVCYIVIFLSGQKNAAIKPVLIRKPWLILPFLLYAAALIYTIYPGLGDMKIPVFVYAGVICLMSLTALNRITSQNRNSFRLVFVGAILFMLSDSLIALGKFAGESMSLPYHSFWIMLTYGIAQYMIIEGLIIEHSGKSAA